MIPPFMIVNEHHYSVPEAPMAAGGESPIVAANGLRSFRSQLLGVSTPACSSTSTAGQAIPLRSGRVGTAADIANLPFEAGATLPEDRPVFGTSLAVPHLID